jgi:ABC-type transport system substrate-binding protein
MKLSAFAAFLLMLLAALLPASPGEPMPLRPEDLQRAAKSVSPAVAAILRELASEAEKGPFDEQRVLERVDALLKTDDPKEGGWAAEKALRAMLRISQSHGAASGMLADRLLEVRRQLLKVLPTEKDAAPALRWADVWLPLYPPESPLANDVRALWIRQAELKLEAGDSGGARKWLDRVDATFSNSPQADLLRKNLRGRAEALVKEAKDQPDGKAVGLLQEALALWPRLPGLRDELEKRKQAYQVLYVAVRDLPEYLSPALAFSDAERQAVELIFEGLVHADHDVKLGPRYRPTLAIGLPTGTGTHRPLVLRRDVYWADGERFTAADVRHTVKLLMQTGTAGGSAWRDLLEPPRLEDNPFGLDVGYRQGLLDPWAPLCFKMLPQQAHGKPLTRADDVEFAKQPLGSGPYQLQGREGAAGRVYVVLRANPSFVRHGQASPGSIREIRFFAWKDSEPGQPAAHVVLDPHPGQLAALRKQGYNDIRNLPVPRTWFLGLNHRRAAFANANVRLALAQAVDRRGLLDRHFRSDLAGATALTVNGPFPRVSWANSPASRVPEELFRPEDARAAARKAGPLLAKVEWTLKYPDGDPRLHAAFKELAEQVGKILASAAVKVVIHPTPLSPRDLQKALRERDFDLIYCHLDLPDSPLSLRPLFDPHADAVAPGGSNFLGYDQDAELQKFLSSAVHHREFAAVQRAMQDVHARLRETMPLIPLWQLPYPVAVHGKLRVSDLDPLAVFGNVLQWKLVP